MDFDKTYLVSGDIRPDSSFKYLINLKNEIDFSILHKEGLPKSALGLTNPKIFLLNQDFRQYYKVMPGIGSVPVPYRWFKTSTNRKLGFIIDCPIRWI